MKTPVRKICPKYNVIFFTYVDRKICLACDLSRFQRVKDWV